MMCMDREDLYERAQWDGAAGTSRRRLLEQIQRMICLPPAKAKLILSVHLAKNITTPPPTRHPPRTSPAVSTRILLLPQ
jgi:hypothetical protein